MIITWLICEKDGPCYNGYDDSNSVMPRRAGIEFYLNTEKVCTTLNDDATKHSANLNKVNHSI